MNNILKFIVFFIIFLGLNLKADAYQIGVWENSATAFNSALAYKYQGIQTAAVKKDLIANISPKDYPILIFSKYQFLDNNTISNIKNYVKNGGKIVLITPSSQQEDTNFIKLAQIIGVNVDNVADSTTQLEVNWVEKTLTNKLNPNSRISKINMNDKVLHLAVFGDIEKHESAITTNTNGTVISWCWGVDGDKKFNEKSMNFIIQDLLSKASNQKNIISNSSMQNAYCDYEEDIQQLYKDRAIIENYQDNVINYSVDMSMARENLERSKINELWALYYAKKGNVASYNQYSALAKQKNLAAGLNINAKDNYETRGIWFDRGTIVKIKSRAEMSHYFEDLKNSGINTVYFETMNAGYTIYPSKIATQNPLTKGKDPLYWAIEEAHARKIKLHAWLWVFAVGNDRHNKLIGKPNTYVGPVLEKNARWALLSETGAYKPKNQPEFWIDPSNKEGVSYLLKITEEIVKNYNIDGIQLDYIRYPFQSADNLMGFNHNSIEQFTSHTGEKIFYNNYQTNVLMNRWKEANVNNFVRKVYRLARSKKSTIKISASIFAKTPENRLSTIQQNYEKWIVGEYIDFLTPMSYSATLDGLSANLANLTPQNGNCLIYPGIALKHVDETSLLSQISMIREKGFSGVSFFAMEQLEPKKVSFLKTAGFKQATFDGTYQPTRAATGLVEEYKNSLILLKSFYYDLNMAQRTEMDNMIAYASAVITKVANNQLSSAITTLKELERRNDTFFKNMFAYNKLRKQTMASYLKRAENLLKVASKKI